MNAYKGTTLGGTDGTVIAYRVGTTTATAYWLASRRFYYYNSYDFSFCDRRISFNGGLTSKKLRYYTRGWGDDSDGFALRPILTLKPDITNTSVETGIDINGTTSAYVLG